MNTNVSTRVHVMVGWDAGSPREQVRGATKRLRERLQEQHKER